MPVVEVLILRGETKYPREHRHFFGVLLPNSRGRQCGRNGAKGSADGACATIEVETNCELRPPGSGHSRCSSESFSCLLEHKCRRRTGRPPYRVEATSHPLFRSHQLVTTRCSRPRPEVYDLTHRVRLLSVIRQAQDAGFTLDEAQTVRQVGGFGGGMERDYGQDSRQACYRNQC